MVLRGSVSSKILGMDTGITIVVPSRHSPENGYRVAYLLHGLCGNSDSWLDNTMLNVYANDGQTVFILPEVSRSFYTDMRHGQNYFSYITEELPGICRNLLHLSGRREDTAMIGASMGGYGALKCALSYPEQYGFCCAFSSACLFLQEILDDLRADNMSSRRGHLRGAQFASDMHAAFGEQLCYDAQNDVLALAKRLQGAVRKPKLYTCCGQNDPLRTDNRRFHDALEGLDFELVYEEWAGRHDWVFFNEALRRALKFCFAQEQGGG